MDVLQKSYVKMLCQSPPDGEGGVYGIKKPTQGDNIASHFNCIT